MESDVLADLIVSLEAKKLATIFLGEKEKFLEFMTKAFDSNKFEKDQRAQEYTKICIQIRQCEKLVEVIWVKCSERLPADCESVLIYCPMTKSMSVGYLFYHKGEPISYMINDFDESDSGASLKDITHWMPLPKPPKEE